MRTFADIPLEVRRRIAVGERVALILLDAFGLAFLRRHAEHPFVRRLEVTPLRTQFPSTTTAHVTTLHFGVPVTEHGLYEWNVLEPALDALICPLRFELAEGADLTGRLDPAALAPGPTFYETLDVRSAVVAPRHIVDSPFSRLATRGARRLGFDDLGQGVRALSGALADGCGYGALYWDRIDSAGHEHGPDSPAFDAAIRATLDALEAELGAAPGITVLLCADHGQIPVAPDRVDYLDVLWPQLTARLAHRRPAGSARDCFLHVAPGEVEGVIEGLTDRLEHRARVVAAAELFDQPGPRLRARLGDVAVLPVAGRQAWLRGAAGPEQRFRGHHGGLEPAETATYLARVAG